MKQETLEEAAKNTTSKYINEREKQTAYLEFIEGAKWQSEQDKNKYSEEDMISFAEFVATYTDKNRNVHGQMLHAKSKYDGAERTVDLFEIWFEQFKKK